MAKESPQQSDVPEKLSDLVGYHLKRASAVDLHGANAALAETGLRTVPMSVLLAVVENSGTSSADICRCLQMQRANIAPILANLEARDLIKRLPDPNDNRIQRLVATTKGCIEARRMLALAANHERFMLQRLTPAEQNELRRLLALIWKDDTTA